MTIASKALQLKRNFDAGRAQLACVLLIFVHQEDLRASYVTSWGESRDHWHQLGNDAISATAHNEGYIQLWGETFNWSFTPMTDFPVMNMNRHSGPLLDMIRFCGIDPAGPSIRISPRLPFDRFSLRLPLIGLAYLHDRHRGTYRPITERSFRFDVALPRGLSCDGFRLLLNGNETEASCRDRHVVFEAEGNPGSRIEWEVVPCEGG